MLDSTGKLYERMILNRVQSELDDPENEGLSEMKYGFRAERSTLAAVQEVQKSVGKAFSMEQMPGGFCAVVTLNVKNAFNTTNWEHIYQALNRSLTGEQPARTVALGDAERLTGEQPARTVALGDAERAFFRCRVYMERRDQLQQSIGAPLLLLTRGSMREEVCVSVSVRVSVCACAHAGREDDAREAPKCG